MDSDTSKTIPPNDNKFTYGEESQTLSRKNNDNLKNMLPRTIIYIVLVIFILCQAFIRFNTSLLMHDLNESMRTTSQQLPYVQSLMETAKEFGEYKHAYDSSLYYMLGAIVVLVLFIVSTKKEK